MPGKRDVVPFSGEDQLCLLIIEIAREPALWVGVAEDAGNRIEGAFLTDINAFPVTDSDREKTRPEAAVVVAHGEVRAMIAKTCLDDVAGSSRQVSTPTGVGKIAIA